MSNLSSFVRKAKTPAKFKEGDIVLCINVVWHGCVPAGLAQNKVYIVKKYLPKTDTVSYIGLPDDGDSIIVHGVNHELNPHRFKKIDDLNEYISQKVEGIEKTSERHKVALEFLNDNADKMTFKQIRSFITALL